MNNFGMNPMGMNQMQINGLGMIGMNNQPNLMDQTALNIKNIIEPYENKIRELEEIIKQKDFEITVLKQKLNNKIPNNNLIEINPLMNMNMNPWMNMNSLNINSEEITVTIISNINKNIKCNKNDKAPSIEKQLTLTFNYKPLDYHKTLGEQGISNYSIINITDNIYNINFTNNSRCLTGLSLDGMCPVKKTIELFFQQINQKYLYPKLLNNNLIHIKFIYNASKLNIEDEAPIKKIFNIDHIPKVIIIGLENYI